MELKFATREAILLARKADIILKRMEAGLYYQWHLGYNELLKEEDLSNALRIVKGEKSNG